MFIIVPHTIDLYTNKELIPYSQYVILVYILVDRKHHTLYSITFDHLEYEIGFSSFNRSVFSIIVLGHLKLFYLKNTEF